MILISYIIGFKYHWCYISLVISSYKSLIIILQKVEFELFTDFIYYGNFQLIKNKII